MIPELCFFIPLIFLLSTLNYSLSQTNDRSNEKEFVEVNEETIIDKKED